MLQLTNLNKPFQFFWANSNVSRGNAKVSEVPFRDLFTWHCFSSWCYGETSFFWYTEALFQHTCKNYWPVTKCSCNWRSHCCITQRWTIINSEFFSFKLLEYNCHLWSTPSRGWHSFSPIPLSVLVMRKMALKECYMRGWPIQLPYGHEVCILCLGCTHTEMALKRSSCQHCEEKTDGVLSMRLFVLLRVVSAAPMLSPPGAVELWERKHWQVLRLFNQPHASWTTPTPGTSAPLYRAQCSPLWRSPWVDLIWRLRERWGPPDTGTFFPWGARWSLGHGALHILRRTSLLSTIHGAEH